MTRISAVLALLVVAPLAHASVQDCQRIGDGTACTGPCIEAGTCQHGVCEPSVLRPDFTPCSSGDRCSRGDDCHAGVCRPGEGHIECPTVDDCTVGVCDPTVGCKLVDMCGPAAKPTPDLNPNPNPNPNPSPSPSPSPNPNPSPSPNPTPNPNLSPSLPLPEAPEPATPISDPNGFVSGKVRGNNLAGWSCDFGGAPVSGSLLHVLLVVAAFALLKRR